MMKQHLILAGVAAVIAVATIWAGAPPTTVLIAAFLLACPVMMLMMMRSPHGHDSLAGQGTVGDRCLQQHERVSVGGPGGHRFDHGLGVQRGAVHDDNVRLSNPGRQPWIVSGMGGPGIGVEPGIRCGRSRSPVSRWGRAGAAV